MGSNQRTSFSGSSNPEYEIVKHIIDIENEKPEIFLNTSKWNIYRVPCRLRNLNNNRNLNNEDPYTPQLVSIGPFHYGQEKLKPMQTQKLRYLALFQERLNKKNNNAEAMKTFKEFIEEKEEAIRHCYAGKLCDDDNIGKDKLVEMMLLDSIFIMELFLRIQARKSNENAYSNDVMVTQTWLNKCIQRDLLLIENQIPLFILEDLYNVIVPQTAKMRPTFIELACDYFECFHTNIKYHSSDDNQETAAEEKSSPGFLQLKNWDKKPEHFTDLIRSFYISKSKRLFHHNRSGLTRSATELQESGVSFVKVIDINRPLMDIKFMKVPILTRFLLLGPKFEKIDARLEIPQLKIDHTTECVLSNIIAFEQCHYPNRPYVCDYVRLLDCLIRTEEDINLLVEKEVIINTLRSKTAVQNLVNGLGRNAEHATNGTSFTYSIARLNNHYSRKFWTKLWNRNMATLRLVYLRDLWRASSTVFGLVVFVFTLLEIYQAIHGVKI